MDKQDEKSSDKTELGHTLESTGSESTQLSPQAVPRDIGAFQIIALGFNIPNSWLAVAVAFSTALTAGGPVSNIRQLRHHRHVRLRSRHSRRACERVSYRRRPVSLCEHHGAGEIQQVDILHLRHGSDDFVDHMLC